MIARKKYKYKTAYSNTVECGIYIIIVHICQNMLLLYINIAKQNMETTSINFNYYDSLFERLNNCKTSDNDIIDILTEIVKIQGTSIDLLEKKLQKIIDFYTEMNKT